MARLKLSRNGLYLIESFEGFRAKSVPLQNGKFTIGFGHSATARENMIINREQAEQLLMWDLIPIEESVRSLIHAPINQNQFDALVSFAFNIGIEQFKTSDVLKFINQGQPVAAAMGMATWRRANINGRDIIVDALIRRRAQEMALFLEPTGTRPAAPTPIVRPMRDNDFLIAKSDVSDIKEIKPIPQTSKFEIDETALASPVTSEATAEIDNNIDDVFSVDADISTINNSSEFATLNLVDDNPTEVVDAHIENVVNDEIEPETSKEAIADKVQEEVITSPINKIRGNLADQAAEIKKASETKPKTSQEDIANYFMIGAGAIAFIAGLYEMFRSGVFGQNGAQIALSPNLIFIEVIAASGLVALIIGLLSKFATEDKKS